MGMNVYVYIFYFCIIFVLKKDYFWMFLGFGDFDGIYFFKWFLGFLCVDLYVFLIFGFDLLVIVIFLMFNIKYLFVVVEFELLVVDGRKGRIFVFNIVCGFVVNILDIIYVLKGGLIKGVVLDVIDFEFFLDGYEFWSMENVIIIFYVFGVLIYYNERVLFILEYNFKRLSEDMELVNKVNKREGY